MGIVKALLIDRGLSISEISELFKLDTGYIKKLRDSIDFLPALSQNMSQKSIADETVLPPDLIALWEKSTAEADEFIKQNEYANLTSAYSRGLKIGRWELGIRILLGCEVCSISEISRILNVYFEDVRKIEAAINGQGAQGGEN